VGVLPNLPGFLGTIKVMEVAPFWTKLYSYAWFVGFFLSGGVYLVLQRLFGDSKAESAGAAG
jgi:NCS1 family nucleobase:cation symporter-1